MTTRLLLGLRGAVLAVGLVCLLSPQARGWSEDDFFQKRVIIARPFVLPQGQGDLNAQTVIGSPRQYAVQKKDTLLDIARYFDLGYNEIIGTYPTMDPWLPPAGEELTLPTFWVLPQSGHQGVVVNIPEMRLYYFPPVGKGETQRAVITLPVGLGREDWPTPVAKFKINGKTPNPVWVIPESIKKERIAEKGWTEDFIPAGSPDNPMGKYRIDLTLPLYKIHDTNNPWAVGRLVTHGCIRMYPEDIAQFFDVVRVGLPGEFVYQPVKVGMFEGKVYAEVHEDIYALVPDLWQEAQRVAQESGWGHLVDQTRLLKVLMEKSGMPVDVTRGGWPEVEDVRVEAAGETTPENSEKKILEPNGEFDRERYRPDGYPSSPPDVIDAGSLDRERTESGQTDTGAMTTIHVE